MIINSFWQKLVPHITIQAFLFYTFAQYFFNFAHLSKGLASPSVRLKQDRFTTCFMTCGIGPLYFGEVVAKAAQTHRETLRTGGFYGVTRNPVCEQKDKFIAISKLTFLYGWIEFGLKYYFVLCN